MALDMLFGANVLGVKKILIYTYYCQKDFYTSIFYNILKINVLAW